MALAASSLSACGSKAETTALEPGRPDTVFQMEPLTPAQRDITLNGGQLAAPGQSIEIVKVRTLTTPNVLYLGAFTVWPRDRDSGSDTDLGFPAQEAKVFHPAFGVVVPATETAFRHSGESAPGTVSVQVGFRLQSGEYGAINDVEVEYRVDDEVRRARSGAGAILCMAPCSEAEAHSKVIEWERELREKLGTTVSDTPALPPVTAPRPSKGGGLPGGGGTRASRRGAA